jgi:hypothetical protein
VHWIFDDLTQLREDEIERRARRVLTDPDGGEDWSSARAEIESKLRRP